MIAVLVIAVLASEVLEGGGRGLGPLDAWTDLSATLENLATFLAIVVGGYLGYRRFLRGGSVLTVTASVRNPGAVSVPLLSPGPFVEVRCADPDLLAANLEGTVPWADGEELIGFPFRDIEGAPALTSIPAGLTLSGSVVLVPPSHRSYRAFWVRLVVPGPAATGELRDWVSDAIVTVPAQEAPHGHSEGEGPGGGPPARLEGPGAAQAARRPLRPRA